MFEVANDGYWSSPTVRNQAASLSHQTYTGVCISKAAYGSPVANGTDSGFRVIVSNQTALPLTSVSLTDPMPRGVNGGEASGDPAGVIATSVITWPTSSAASCNFGSYGVDAATNTASITNAAVPDKSACEWRVLFKGWNDGPSNHSNTDGTKPIVRTNVIPKANIALQSAQGPVVYPSDVSAPVTITPPWAILG